jgi:hypothetical protein
MADQAPSEQPPAQLTDELRCCLRAVMSNPLHPDLSAEHVDRLIALGLVTRLGQFLAITQAGRRAAYSKE